MLRKAVKFVLGLALLPVCAGVTRALVALLLSIQPPADVLFSPPMLALIGGGGLWLLVYTVLPRPTRAYVLAHELTHALWGLCLGARVMNLRVHRETGSVTLSRSNFLISLAPYFFPLYTVCVIVAYYVAALFAPVERYTLLWLALIGFTWGFHVTFTFVSLLQRQTDLREHGRLFSYAVIYCLNALGVAFVIVLVSRATFGQLLGLLWDHVSGMLLAVLKDVAQAVHWIVQRATKRPQ